MSNEATVSSGHRFFTLHHQLAPNSALNSVTAFSSKVHICAEWWWQWVQLASNGHVESGESSGVGGEAHVEGGEEGITDVVEGAVEVQNDYAVDVDNEDVRDVDNDDALEVQKEDLLDVDNEDWLDVEHDDALEVEKEDSVDNEDVEHEDAEDDEVAVEVENEDEPPPSSQSSRPTKFRVRRKDR
ncbi:hypothetical protein LR48_Vigan07g112600 [Vigna angularis]|uniref:Uncharacterized protein n=1 Tax=Phaseolus angularis TaxID=3914 RepID=A0A0L9UXW8_PHAAN|nr:hypothetical protein LR48_Vigan07g112600 [Vigna angularis]